MYSEVTPHIKRQSFSKHPVQTLEYENVSKFNALFRVAIDKSKEGFIRRLMKCMNLQSPAAVHNHK